MNRYIDVQRCYRNAKFFSDVLIQGVYGVASALVITFSFSGIETCLCFLLVFDEVTVCSVINCSQKDKNYIYIYTRTCDMNMKYMSILRAEYFR